MSSLIDALQQCLTRRNEHREALAEAILLHGLQRMIPRRRFSKLLGLHGNTRIVHCESQKRSDSGDARHDLVLTTKTGRELFVELKGFAGFTRRQQNALQGKASDAGRIDVLVVPRAVRDAMPQPVKDKVDTQTISGPAIITWEDIDTRVIHSRHLGRLASLWHGTTVWMWKDLRAAARSYIEYYRDGDSSGESLALWSSLGSLANLLPELSFSRTRGTSSGQQFAHYGRRFTTPQGQRFWLGWVFNGGTKGKFNLALLLTPLKGTQCPPSLCQQLPHWTWPEAQGTVLALAEAVDELNLQAVATRLRKGLRLRNVSST